MTRRFYTLTLAAALLLAGPAFAQSEAPQSDAEFAERMREAEERLAEAARRVAELSSERLESMGDIKRYAFEFSAKPRLGVTIESRMDDSPVEGVRVIGVTPGSAAADAGLRAGDVITAVNGESMSAASSTDANRLLLDFMRGVEEGDRLEVEYLRDGKVGKVEVEPRIVEHNPFAWLPGGSARGVEMESGIGAPPGLVEKFRYAFGGWHATWSDMELVSLSKDLGRYFGTDAGLLVISAPKSGKLRDGDVIRSIDGREPTSVSHCMRILGSYQPGEKLELAIMRDKKPQTIQIEVPDDRSSRLRPGTSSPLSQAGPAGNG